MIIIANFENFFLEYDYHGLLALEKIYENLVNWKKKDREEILKHISKIQH